MAMEHLLTGLRYVLDRRRMYSNIRHNPKAKESRTRLG
jgi:hypothetical protein